VEPSLEDRLRAVEAELEGLRERIQVLEGAPDRAAVTPTIPKPGAAPPAPVEPAPPAEPAAAASDEAPREQPARPPPEPGPPAADRTAPPPRPPRPEVDLEDLLGGRVLAWVGGLAVFLGVVFFVAMAVRRGWIDESTRVVLAFLGSSALLGLGVWLYERRGQTEAAVAAVAASIGALYASLTAATQLYELIAPAAGLGVAALVGATATAIAVRWESRLVGALGILGALASPVLVDAGTAGATLAFMGIALCSAAGVVVWRRWDWLAVAAFLVSVPQLLAWIGEELDENLALTLVVLALFWLVYAVAAVGYELRERTGRLRPSSGSLVLVDGILLAGAGWLALEDRGYETGATGWVVGAALVHCAVGASSFRGRVSKEIALLYLAVAIGLSAIAVALALDGPGLVAAWSVEAVVLTWLGARSGYRRSYLGAGVLLTLAALHVALVDAPPDLLVEDGAVLRPVVAVALVALASFAAARLYAGPHVEVTTVLDAFAAAAAAYGAAIALDGAWLVLALAVAAVALAWLARRFAHAVALDAAVGYLVVAAGHVLAFDAPPDALREGVDSLPRAALALAGVVAGGFAVRSLAGDAARELVRLLAIGAAIAAVYLPSVAIVDLATGERTEPGQTPQVLLSAFWSLTGLGAIVYGLLRNERRFRLGGLILLSIAVAKVFLYDLAALDEIFRVASFVVLGLLLLAGAYAYARMRRSAGKIVE
jgi:uncharacterized membrane protein